MEPRTPQNLIRIGSRARARGRPLGLFLGIFRCAEAGVNCRIGSGARFTRMAAQRNRLAGEARPNFGPVLAINQTDHALDTGKATEVRPNSS